jgi:cold shock CspA family protein
VPRLRGHPRIIAVILAGTVGLHRPDDGGRDVFRSPFRALQRSGLETLIDGASVEFELGPDRKGRSDQVGLKFEPPHEVAFNGTELQFGQRPTFPRCRMQRTTLVGSDLVATAHTNSQT